MELIDPGTRRCSRTRGLDAAAVRASERAGSGRARRRHVARQIDALGLPEDERELIAAFWTLNFNGPIEDAAYPQAMRWCSWRGAAGRSCSRPARRTSSVTARARWPRRSPRMATPSRLETTVESIAADRPCRCPTASSSQLGGLVTLPLHALRELDVRCRRASAGRSRQAVARAQGVDPAAWRPRAVRGARRCGLAHHVRADRVLGGRRHARRRLRTRRDGHRPDGPRRSPEPLRRLLPEAEVVDIASQTGWRTSLGETWPMGRTGALTGSLPTAAAGGPARAGGGGYAMGWAGFIDGAIESGMRAARTVERILGGVAATLMR